MAGSECGIDREGLAAQSCAVPVVPISRVADAAYPTSSSATACSYFQDAVANEAYLDTLRQRISARRHARLIDYRMHDGRNAWACVHIAVNAAFALPAGTPLLSHIGAPLLGGTVAPGVVIDGNRINAVSLLSDPALDGVVVFETVAVAALDPANDAIFIHSWGNEECCLPSGTTEAFLFTLRADGKTAALPVLQQGDYLLIEEVLGPRTGLAADADPTRRQVVLIDQAPAGDHRRPVQQPDRRWGAASLVDRRSAAAAVRRPLAKGRTSSPSPSAFPIASKMAL